MQRSPVHLSEEQGNEQQEHPGWKRVEPDPDRDQEAEPGDNAHRPHRPQHRTDPRIECVAAVEEWVAAILAAGPRAIRLQKALIRDWEELTLSEAVERGIDAFAEAYETREPAEQMSAFLSRKSRAP